MLAHTPGEYVTAGDLAQAAGVMERLLQAGS